MGRNFDYPQPLEGRLAKSYLWAIEKDARELRVALLDDDQLPGWVTAKIVTAQDRISGVSRYMDHKIHRRTVKNLRKNPSVGDTVNLVTPFLVVGGFLLVTGLFADRLRERKSRAALE